MNSGTVATGSEGVTSSTKGTRMKLATGEIFTWLNSDDMLAPGALYAVALAFHTSNADLISGIALLHNPPPNVGSASADASHTQHSALNTQHSALSTR